MVSACTFTVLLEHPASPVHRALPDPLLRRALMGCAMGLTAVGLIYSRWGRRSGAHMNPAVTLTFTRLGKVHPRDAAVYVAAQFAGGAAGVALAASLLGSYLEDRHVHYAATLPGAWGAGAAWLAELAITFVLMTAVLRVSNHPRHMRWTGACAGLLVACYITVEAPISGMSMNPARTLASALGAHDATALWIYFTAPLVGMLAAAEVYVRGRGTAAVSCAKLDHAPDQPCIFCEHQGRAAAAWNLPGAARITTGTTLEGTMKRPLLIAGVVVLGGVAWYLFRPELLFVNKRVHEELAPPVAQAAETGASAAPAALSRGQFHSVAHETHGTATILDVGGRRVLRLTDFATSNGPDVRVYLVAAEDATDNAAVKSAGYVELGALKGNEGDQNYDVPADLDLTKYRAVTIWCHRFGVNFATAPLTPAS
jgi:aquaporin Z